MNRYASISEKEWQAQVLEIFGYHGWKVTHAHKAMLRDGSWITPVDADGKGFPDLLAVHPAAGDILVAELKTEKGTASPEQLQWLTWFEAAQISAYLWRPHDVDAVIARISDPQRRVRLSRRQGRLSGPEQPLPHQP